MFKYKIFNNIAQEGIKVLDHNKFIHDEEEPHALILRSKVLSGQDLDESLYCISRAGAGINNIPIEAATKKAIVVFNTPGANANAVKELVISSMLLASRNICQGWDYVNKLPLENLKTTVEDGKKQYSGSELPGKTLGIVGLGAIGVEIANAASMLGMDVIGYDPSISKKNAWKISSEVEEALSLEELFSRSDFVSFHVPLVDATKNLLDAKRISLLPEGCVIINMSRDGIVDEDELIKSLDSGKVKYYVTDFPIDEKKNHDRVIALPHLGASTSEAEENCAIMIAKQVKDYLEHGNIVNSVNFPDSKMPRAGEERLAITHRNVPNMVRQITKEIAEEGANIVDMLNKSRGDFAYTLIDIEKEIPKTVIENIKQVEGILKVRAL